MIAQLLKDGSQLLISFKYTPNMVGERDGGQHSDKNCASIIRRYGSTTKFIAYCLAAKRIIVFTSHAVMW